MDEALSIHFGPYDVHPTQGLRQGLREIRLTPKSLAVLYVLAQRPGEVVTKSELFRDVWRDTVVTDAALSSCIRELRQALHDDAKVPRFIETIHRRGFRLRSPSGLAFERQAAVESTSGVSNAQPSIAVLPFEDRGRPAPRGGRAAWAAGVAVVLMISIAVSVWFANRPAQVAQLADRSLAVVSFSVIGGDAEMARYADAVTQELRTDVAGYREIRSVAVADATNIRDVTDASYVVNGNVQRRGADVRVRAGLTRTSDHQTVWAESFEQPASDKKADPAEMAATIGRFIRYQLVQDQQCESVRRTSPSAAAATAYCAAYAEGGRFEQVGGGDPQLVLRDLQHAIALDPGIADAYAGLASTYRALGESGAMDWREAARHANDALARGFALAPPNDPYLLSERGWLQGVLELNYPAAEASLRASLQADPLGPRAQWNYVGLGELALAQGNLHVALEHFRRALRINDSSATIYQFYSLSLLFLGENREAIKVANGGIDLVQGGEARFYLLICTADAHYALGETAAGNAALNQALASAEPAFKPMLLAPLGRTEEAWQLLAQLEANEHPPIPTMVFAYAVLDHDRAFEWIHTAIERHIWPVVISLRVPIYPKLRQDPRWAEVMNHLESEEAKGRAGYRRVTTDHGRRQPE